MTNLCIIPARGGSKRIPRKNIKNFLGKPIIAYSIEAALGSDLFEDVIVSTEDEEIAEIAKQYGARVPFMRSKKNADDFATLSDVITEVKENYQRTEEVFENICCILPTAPLINSSHLIQAYHVLINSAFDNIRPVVKFSYPIQRALELKSDGSVSFFYPENALTRSQDLKSSFHDAGQFYWMKSKHGLKSTNRGGIIVSEKYVQDIDTMEDWELAELKYKWNK